MRYLVTGPDGFIASALISELARRRHEVHRLTRGPLNAADPRLFGWDPATGKVDERAFEGVEGVVHLAGAGIADHRWSAAYKETILQSRMLGTRALVQAMAKLATRPKVLLSGSAVGFYGDRGTEPMDEDSTPGSGFLAEVCQAWEAEAVQAETLGVRVVRLRSGSVLDPSGGSLAKMALPFKLCLGGRLGSGRQIFSWISLRDHVRAMLFLMEHAELSGAFNLTGPNPVSNAHFTAALARALNRPAVFPLPAFAARLAFGEMADALLLTGQAVLPRRLKEAGFQFEQPFIGEALGQLFSQP